MAQSAMMAQLMAKKMSITRDAKTILHILLQRDS
jgi:hypothetical protein